MLQCCPYLQVSDPVAASAASLLLCRSHKRLSTVIQGSSPRPAAAADGMACERVARASGKPIAASSQPLEWLQVTQ